MPKLATVYACTECGGETPRWAGQCPHCRTWNTLQEFKPVHAAGRSRQPSTSAQPVSIVGMAGVSAPRLRLGWSEVNRVLGGGLVKGSLVLIGGEPGIGKSTLLMHVAHQVAAAGGSVLYATGEESAEQVRLRAARLDALHPGILLLAENDLDSMVEVISAAAPAVAIVDSIQTVSDATLGSAAGTVTQVREGAARLMRLAKASGTPIVLVGHVTKEGSIAGPRVLEHIVDTVLYLEGDRQLDLRVLRATKNRFGSTDEVGLFAMGDGGLRQVEDASSFLLADSSSQAGGSVVLATVEGTRPLLVELQSLVVETSFGMPRRVANGVDANRLHMIVAVVEKRARLPLRTSDIFVNVAGGMMVREPAADLGLALAIIGNKEGQPLPPQTVVFGELGLMGEVRKVGQVDRRLAEAARHGFTRALIPAGNTVNRDAGIETIPVRHLEEAMASLLEPGRAGLMATS